MSGVCKELNKWGCSGGGWEAEGGLQLTLGHRQWYCVFSKELKQAQTTG